MTREAKEVVRDAAGIELDAVRDMVRACMQCGTCSATCPNVLSMESPPRKLWRLLLMGFTDEVLAGGSFFLCSSCYACTLRCPRGLPLTEAMAALRRLAARHYPETAGRNPTFYETFMHNVRMYGRVQETALMTRYFMAMKNPALPLEFTSLGLRLLGKGKLHGPSGAQKGRLEPMFEKAGLEGGRS